MKHFSLSLLILVLAFACTQKPAPVATDTKEVLPEERLAIAVEYVGVPKMEVRQSAAEAAPVVGTYGFTEAISVLEIKGDWKMIRTFDGAGWVKAADLLPGDQISKIDTTVPRFYVVPAAVPATWRGELSFQAKVNTDGDVVEVKTVQNTTGSQAAADANADALKAAKFYPMVDGGTRKTFIYEYRVYY